MIDIEKAKNEFIKYTEKYDLTNDHIKRKQLHSLRVMEISEKIATNLKLDEERKELAILIGLLHDIARFEQYTRFKTFRDFDSIDHGDLGVKILENDIRKYVESNKYDDIIKCAIKNHNKFKIEDGLDEEKLLFCKIIRDADKIDIFYEGTEYFWKNENEIYEIENGLISDDLMEEFLTLTIINRQKAEKSIIANVVCNLAFMFDIYFEESLEYIKEKDYINKIINRFNFKNEDTRRKMEIIRKTLNDYINSKEKK